MCQLPSAESGTSGKRKSCYGPELPLGSPEELTELGAFKEQCKSQGMTQGLDLRLDPKGMGQSRKGFEQGRDMVRYVCFKIVSYNVYLLFHLIRKRGSAGSTALLGWESGSMWGLHKAERGAGRKALSAGWWSG